MLQEDILPLAKREATVYDKIGVAKQRKNQSVGEFFSHVDSLTRQMTTPPAENFSRFILITKVHRYLIAHLQSMDMLGETRVDLENNLRQIEGVIAMPAGISIWGATEHLATTTEPEASRPKHSSTPGAPSRGVRATHRPRSGNPGSDQLPGSRRKRTQPRCLQPAGTLSAKESLRRRLRSGPATRIARLDATTATRWAIGRRTAALQRGWLPPSREKERADRSSIDATRS